MLFQDMGILKKFYEDELRAPIPIPLPKTADEEPINLPQMSTAFMWYAFGIVCGIVAFIIEHVRHRVAGKKLKEGIEMAPRNYGGIPQAWK